MSIIRKPRESDDVWWFGWDAAHAGDQSPKMDAMLRALGHHKSPILRDYETYRTLGYVKAELASLAEQLHTVGNRIFIPYRQRMALDKKAFERRRQRGKPLFDHRTRHAMGPTFAGDWRTCLTDRRSRHAKGTRQ